MQLLIAIDYHLNYYKYKIVKQNYTKHNDIM